MTGFRGPYVPHDWIIGFGHSPFTCILNVTADEFLWLQKLKAFTAKTDTPQARDAFYRRAGQQLGEAEVKLARQSNTRLRVRFDCIAIPSRHVPRIEVLPSN